MPQRTRSQRLNGLFPLSYVGVIPVSPINFVIDNRPPNGNDSKNFYIGDLWLDYDSNLPSPPQTSNLWILVSLANGVATWRNFAGAGGGVQTLSGDAGINPVFPDGAMNINVFGDNAAGLTVVGDGVNTLTVSTTGGFRIGQFLTGDIGGAVPFNAAGNINVITNVAGINSGSSVLISGNIGTNTLTLNVTDANENTLIGRLAGNATMTAARCTAVGFEALNALTTSVDTTAVGWDAGTNITTGNNNTLMGSSAGQAITTGHENTCIGADAGAAIVGGVDNTCIGTTSGQAITAGLRNSYFGSLAGNLSTTGNDNTALGAASLPFLLTGSRNIVIGSIAGSAYIAAETDNIVIGSPGTVGDNTTIRMGTLGTHTRCFVQGISGVAVANELPVMINSATGQLGTSAGIVAIQYTTDSGVAVPAANNLNIFGAHGINTSGAGSTVTVAINNAISLGDLAVIAANGNALNAVTGDVNIAAGNLKIPDSNSTFTQGTIFLNGVRYFNNFSVSGTAVSPNLFIGSNAGNGTQIAPCQDNVGVGHNCFNLVTFGNQNTAIGNLALSLLTEGINNCAVGLSSLQNATTAFANVAMGTSNLRSLISGSVNTGIGFGVLDGITTGSTNTALGFEAGASLTGSDSDNIMIANPGVIGDNNTIRIGTSGAGQNQQNRCFIAGIRGITTGVVNAIAVLIDSAGQLGTVSSAVRYKENIQDLGNDSNIIYSLRPVKFNYRKHPDIPAWGLIAEEVSEIFPSLTAYDGDGQPESVKYHELPVLLLNEIKKLRTRIDDLEYRLNRGKCGC